MKPTLASNTPKDGKPLRILLECSNTLISGTNTGIQRVARNLAREGIIVAEDLGLICEPVLIMHGRLRMANNWLSQMESDAAIKSQEKPKKHSNLEASPKPKSTFQRLFSLLNPANFRRVATRELRTLKSPRLNLISGDVLVLTDVWWLDDHLKLQQNHI